MVIQIYNMLAQTRLYHYDRECFYRNMCWDGFDGIFRRQAHIWTNDGKFFGAYMRHSASMGLTNGIGPQLRNQFNGWQSVVTHVVQINTEKAVVHGSFVV